MAGAVKHPGALTRKAKAAGMSVAKYATSHEHAAGATGKQARLAKIFARYRKGKKRA